MDSRNLGPHVSVPAAAILALFTFGPALGQVRLPRDPTVYRITGKEDEKFLGKKILTLGDTDGDGIRDFAAETTLHVSIDDVRTRIHIFSGKTGTLLRTWESPQGGLIAMVAAYPDLDDDGWPELGIFDTPGAVKVLSPVTGETWYTYWGPEAQHAPGVVEILPDLDGDGIDEFVAGDGSARMGEFELAGTVTLHSGKQGAPVIWTRPGMVAEGHFGADVTPAGDHDGDGYPDLLVRGAMIGEDKEQLVLWVLSGRTGKTLRRYEPGWSGEAIIGNIITLPDQDGNGFPEVAMAVPFHADPAEIDAIGNGEGRGWVGVYSLPELQLLTSFRGRDARTRIDWSGTGDWLGWKLAIVGDTNADGSEDYAMITWSVVYDLDWHGRLYLHSGSTNEVLMVYEAWQQFGPAFTAIAALGDMDGDGKAEFLAGNENQLLHDELGNRIYSRGAIRVLRHEPEGSRYVRGDVNGDGRVNVTDALVIFNAWLAREPPACPAAFDVMGEGWVGPEDALWLVNYLFKSYSLAPYPPFPECGRFTRIDASDLFYRVLPCDGPDLCPGG
jgi:hypothetical protein